MSTNTHAAVSLLARILLAAIFIQSGWGKLGHAAETANYMQSHGVPGQLVWLVIATELGGGLAVLLGLFDESDADRTQREHLDSLRSAALDSDLSQQRALNVLQRTQLQQKQALERELLET